MLNEDPEEVPTRGVTHRRSENRTAKEATPNSHNRKRNAHMQMPCHILHRMTYHRKAAGNTGQAICIDILFMATTLVVYAEHIQIYLQSGRSSFVLKYIFLYS